MKIAKQGTLLIWMAFGFLSLFVTLTTLLNFLEYSDNTLLMILLIASGVLGIAAIFLLFSFASRYVIMKHVEDSEMKESEEEPSKTKPQGEAKQIEKLDIPGVAKKIARRSESLDSPEKWGASILKQLSSEIEIMSGIVYMKNKEGRYDSIATYAYPHAKAPYSFKVGEGINGEAVKNMQLTVFRNIPEEYTRVISGLGSGNPSYLVIAPIEINKDLSLVIEIAGYRYVEENLEQLFNLLSRELIQKHNPDNLIDSTNNKVKEKNSGEKND